MTIPCASCRSNQESMSTWMIHLANCHPLPSQWLSDKAKMLTADENRRPYTVVTDSRKRRRQQTTPRPLNTFMIFSRHMRRNILAVFPEASNSLVSKELGLLWKQIAHDVKTCYEEEAKRLVQLHAQEFPDYKYQPKKRLHRLSRSVYERQVSPTNTSHMSPTTDDENVHERDNRSSSDIENQYFRYTILGKNLVKECQTFTSPLKTTQIKTEVKVEELPGNNAPKPFQVRYTNFGDSNIFLKQHQRNQATENVYMIPSENYVSSSAVITQLIDNSAEEEIDITGNIFSNEMDLEWCEYDDDERHDMPHLSTMF